MGVGGWDLGVALRRWVDGPERIFLMPPCGRCREVISDMYPAAWVIVGTLESPYRVRVSELLPLKE